MRLMPALSAAAVIVFAVTVGLDAAGGSSETSDDRSSPGMALQAEDSASGAFGPPEAVPETAQRNAQTAEDGGTTATPPVPSAAGAPAPDEGSDSDSAPGDATESYSAATQPADQGQMDVEATAADSDDDGGNNMALRIVEVASAAVAIVAAGVALRAWRKRGEAAA
jgi:hypothetical protein